MITVWVVMVLCLIGLTITGFLGCFAPQLQGGSNENVEVFTVDGQAVTLKQVNDELASLHSRLGASTNPLADIQFNIIAITGLVDRALKANMAATRGVTVDDGF